MFIFIGILILPLCFAKVLKCPHTCASSNVSDTEFCNTTSKECLFGCKVGYYGDLCENTCNGSITYCKSCSIQSNNSVACDECLRNFYKYNGNCIECNYWCGVNISSLLPKCRKSDGYCNFGCRTGHYGFRCASLCRGTCKDKCDRDNGHCLTGCKYQSYCGPTCDLTCNDGCAYENCDQSCTCRHGCTRNKWGDQCDNYCSVNCNESPDENDENSNICERSNGSCSFKCKNNTFWGSQCDKKCSTKCNGGICEQATGNCTDGCNSKEVYGIGCDRACNKNCINGTCERADGYCDNGCVTGTYGVHCELKCNERCNNHTCSRATGYCLDGCREGWRGQRCDIKCNDNCIADRCEQQMGYCIFGCVTGWYGNLCSKPCSDRCLNFVCNREDGDCVYGLIGGEGGTDYMNFNQVAILGSGWLLSLVLIVALIVIAIRRHKKSKVWCDDHSAKDNQRENTGTLDRPPEVYMTLEKESRSSKSTDMYVTLNPDKVCKHGKNFTEECLPGNK